MKKILPAISFKKYLSLEDKTEYNYALEFGKFKPIDVFQIGDFKKQSFQFVKDLQHLFSTADYTWNDLFLILENKKKITSKKIGNLTIFEFKSFLKFIHDEIDKINHIESVKLSHKPTLEEDFAGIDKFSVYGAFLQYDALSNGDVTKIEKIKKLPYDICFLKLCLSADRYDFEKNLTEQRKK